MKVVPLVWAELRVGVDNVYGLIGVGEIRGD